MPIFPGNPDAEYGQGWDVRNAMAPTSDAAAANVTLALVTPVRQAWSTTQAAAASTTGVHAAVTDTGAQQVVTTGITNPPCARNITATAGGTNTDIKAISVIVSGTDINGAAISETLPAFTVDTAGSVTGSKAFATVTSITIPAHDGTGATTAVGFGSKLGLAHKLSTNTVLLASLGGTKEGTAPTVATSSSAVCSNTMLLNSSLNGTQVLAYYLVAVAP